MQRELSFRKILARWNEERERERDKKKKEEYKYVVCVHTCVCGCASEEQCNVLGLSPFPLFVFNEYVRDNWRRHRAAVGSDSPATKPSGARRGALAAVGVSRDNAVGGENVRLNLKRHSSVAVALFFFFYIFLVGSGIWKVARGLDGPPGEASWKASGPSDRGPICESGERCVVTESIGGGGSEPPPWNFVDVGGAMSLPSFFFFPIFVP